MKITNEQLTRIIKEELESILSELNDSAAGTGETTGLSGPTGYAPSAKEVDRKKREKQQLADRAMVQAAAASALADEKIAKELEQIQRNAPTNIKNMITRNKDDLVKRSTRAVTANKRAGALYGETNRAVFYDTIQKFFKMSKYGFGELVEAEATKIMMKKTKTKAQMHRKYFDKSEDFTPQIQEEIVNAVSGIILKALEQRKIDRSKRSFGQRVGDFFSGKGFEE